MCSSHMTHSVVGDEQVSDGVALALLLSLDLDGDVSVHHRAVTGPVLSTLLLQGETNTHTHTKRTS